MMTMISTFLSFLAGGLPKILGMMQDKQDKFVFLALLVLHHFKDFWQTACKE